MARKKKKGTAVAADAPYNGGTRHWNIGVDEAENGFIVNTSCESRDGYKSKKHIAPNERAAIRIATAHIAGLGAEKKGGKKKGKGKIAISKRS